MLPLLARFEKRISTSMIVFLVTLQSTIAQQPDVGEGEPTSNRVQAFGGNFINYDYGNRRAPLIYRGQTLPQYQYSNGVPYYAPRYPLNPIRVLPQNPGVFAIQPQLFSPPERENIEGQENLNEVSQQTRRYSVNSDERRDPIKVIPIPLQRYSVFVDPDDNSRPATRKSAILPANQNLFPQNGDIAPIPTQDVGEQEEDFYRNAGELLYPYPPQRFLAQLRYHRHPRRSYFQSFPIPVVVPRRVYIAPKLRNRFPPVLDIQPLPSYSSQHFVQPPSGLNYQVDPRLQPALSYQQRYQFPNQIYQGNFGEQKVAPMSFIFHPTTIRGVQPNLFLQELKAIALQLDHSPIMNALFSPSSVPLPSNSPAWPSKYEARKYLPPNSQSDEIDAPPSYRRNVVQVNGENLEPDQLDKLQQLGASNRGLFANIVDPYFRERSAAVAPLQNLMSQAFGRGSQNMNQFFNNIGNAVSNKFNEGSAQMNRVFQQFQPMGSVMNQAFDQTSGRMNNIFNNQLQIPQFPSFVNRYQFEENDGKNSNHFSVIQGPVPNIPQPSTPYISPSLRQKPEESEDDIDVRINKQSDSEIKPLGNNSQTIFSPDLMFDDESLNDDVQNETQPVDEKQSQNDEVVVEEINLNDVESISPENEKNVKETSDSGKEEQIKDEMANDDLVIMNQVKEETTTLSSEAKTEAPEESTTSATEIPTTTDVTEIITTEPSPTEIATELVTTEPPSTSKTPAGR